MVANITVEVVYALPEKQYIYKIQINKGSTVEQAISTSGVLELRPEINLQQNKVGIFSRAVRLTDEVEEGDRIEIYRPLLADPKDLRRNRAEKSRQKQKNNQSV